MDHPVPEDLAFRAARGVVANRMLPRMKGLLGRRELASGEGMLIRPASSIHTFFMRFPIDAIFLSRDGEVLKVAANVGAWRARSRRRAHSVLELPAGEAERRAIAPGDRLEFRKRTPALCRIAPPRTSSFTGSILCACCWPVAIDVSFE
jgi:uncharacterized membrane protein (UPF0127 family)